jgi:hypothetical protein
MLNTTINDMNSQKKCAVLVVSCDNYSDVWLPYFDLFRRFWGSCPYPIYLLTNHIIPDIDNVQIINVGDDISWSDNLTNALGQIQEEYVFLFLEDLLLIDYVISTQVEKVIDWAIENDCNYLRLNPSTKPDMKFNANVGVVSKGTIYRASVVVCLWKKKVLNALLKKGENAWEFEHYGSIRSDSYDGFYSTYHNHFPIINSIIKRVWETSAIRKLKHLQVAIDFSKRRKMTLLESILWKCKLLRSLIFNLFPAKVRRSIKSFAQGGKLKI